MCGDGMQNLETVHCACQVAVHCLYSGGKNGSVEDADHFDLMAAGDASSAKTVSDYVICLAYGKPQFLHAQTLCAGFRVLL